MKRQERDKLTVPESAAMLPLFPCTMNLDAPDGEEVTDECHSDGFAKADELVWYDGGIGLSAGWYCHKCGNEFDIPRNGPTLASVIAERET